MLDTGLRRKGVVASRGQHEADKSGGVLARADPLLITWGYLAPEYALLGQLTKKADIYSFGVVILEVFISWVELQTWKLREQGRLLEIVDPDLDKYPEEQMLRFIKVALLCTQATAHQRPSMKQVVHMLSNQTEVDLQNVVPPGVLKKPRQRTGGFPGLTLDTSSSQSTKCNPAESYSTQTNMNSYALSTVEVEVSPR
ncbi:hypothetical protein PR202_ga26278 [Eleusine coracana subsp. coracana]|uniref:Protein kinase domain-containing protein n=1 Tax=Eleusine coracana subsp. coracana TaxID=191504 RepID=A0AAV5DE22_ELECO|nr:hypothetical protein PR202_ga26278 [Eleusine coracana subsp. coracana]